MRITLLIAALLLCVGCGHRFAAQLVLEPQESASEMSIGATQVRQAPTTINPQLPTVNSDENRALFAPGRNPF